MKKWYGARRNSYYILDTSTVLLIEECNHCFRQMERKWFCDSCDRVRKQKSIIQGIFSQHEDKLLNTPKDLNYLKISQLPIPFVLSNTMANVYSDQLVHGILLPISLIPESEIC